MKYVVRKAYWNYEKEEKWLNEMSAKGLALSDYSWCRYVFSEAPNNEYTYRIELLENPATHAESQAYIRFLEENGVECVASYMRWIYLRKKTEEGPFDIYSDLDSKIAHLKRIRAFWSTLMWMELAAGLCNIAVVAADVIFFDDPGDFPLVNLTVGSSVLLLGLLFFVLGRPLKKRIKNLQKEKEIRE